MQENQSATDQTTCKLNCNAVGTVLTPPSSYNIYAGAPPSDADARAAVIRSSGGVVPGSAQPRPTTPTAQPSAPPAATPERVAQCAAQAQQCASSCSVQLAPCNQSCDQGKMSSTDRATCKLTCETNVDVCRDDCRIKEGTCRGPVYKP